MLWKSNSAKVFFKAPKNPKPDKIKVIKMLNCCSTRTHVIQGMLLWTCPHYDPQLSCGRYDDGMPHDVHSMGIGITDLGRGLKEEATAGSFFVQPSRECGKHQSHMIALLVLDGQTDRCMDNLVEAEQNAFGDRVGSLGASRDGWMVGCDRTMKCNDKSLRITRNVCEADPTEASR